MSNATAQLTLDTASFDAIAELAYRESGLTLVPEKAIMIQSRLRHRLRALGIVNFADYTEFVRSDNGHAERRRLISALTTNVSHFFREEHHFEVLTDQILAKALPVLRSGGKLRIWSAGCSNGQEPCSAAIALLERAPEVATLDVRILATDIDTEVIRFAREGRYPERLMRGVSDLLRDKYFVHDGSGSQATYVAKPVLRNMIRFNELNLLDEWPMKNTFDAIFCRNVVIYFDPQTQLRLWPRFCRALSADGFLFLGHSERIADPDMAQVTCSGPTTYRRRPP